MKFLNVSVISLFLKIRKIFQCHQKLKFIFHSLWEMRSTLRNDRMIRERTSAECEKSTFYTGITITKMGTVVSPSKGQLLSDGYVPICPTHSTSARSIFRIGLVLPLRSLYTWPDCCLYQQEVEQGLARLCYVNLEASSGLWVDLGQAVGCESLTPYIIQCQLPFRLRVACNKST